MQREEPPVMTTGLERIAVKARCEPKLRFTSLAHHITKERVWENLSQIPAKSAAGVDGQTVAEAKESFEEWVAGMLQSVHREGYRAPDIRRVYIPKPGKQEMRPLGVPTVADRALQRSASQVLSAIYEQDFLPCSFGGRAGRGAHQALATLYERIAGGKIEWVLEADLKHNSRYCSQSCISPTGSCKLSPYCESTFEERSAVNPHAPFCGSRRWATTSGHPVGSQQGLSLPRSVIDRISACNDSEDYTLSTCSTAGG